MLPLLLALSAPAALPAHPERLVIEPVPAPAPGRTGILGFRIRAPWMRGRIELRMPETLASSMGLHFIDHVRSDMPPLSVPNPWPVWQQDRRNGSLRYSHRTPEGVEFSALARPATDEVVLEFRVRNRTGKAISSANCQMCLVLTESPDFGERNTLEPIRAWVDGAFLNLAQTTPTPASKGRDPWILMRVRGPGEAYRGPMDYADGWWVVDQLADRPVIARVSEDGTRLVAIEWGARQPMLMSNTRIPCLHAGPGDPASIEPGAEHVWRGRILLLPNDPEELRRRLEQGWSAAPRQGRRR
ncbi:MAG TPA: hypothetical protein VLH79_07470 [Chthonomonadales bacterium]|nr:hypothetical protein [Chthonomonadales bacterium]